MMAFATTDPICREICDALGFSHARKVVLTMEVNSAVTVDVEYFAEEEGVAQLPVIIAKYELIDKREVEQLREDSSELTRRIAWAVFKGEAG